MLEILKEKLKLNKWFYFIPVLGTMIYTVMFEFAVNKIVLEGNKQFKKIKKYKTIVNLISFAILIPFIICFFILRNKHGFGPFPWFFWLGLSLGLGQNIVPYIPYVFYKKGIEEFEKVAK